MFTYIDHRVREKLASMGKLVRIDSNGKLLDINQPPAEGVVATSMLGPIPLPMRIADLNLHLHWYACVNHTDITKVEQLARDLKAANRQTSFATMSSFLSVNSVLVVGDTEKWQNPLVRIHSNCFTGDIFGSLRCDCGPQLHSAILQIYNEEQGGMLIYMAGHEGRGIGLWAKAATYILQDNGEDTYEANQSLGLPDDSRNFSDAATLLKFFIGNRGFRLLSNNPKKIKDLNAMGLNNIEPVKHIHGINDFNREYMRAKSVWGHKIKPSDFDR